MNMTLGSLFAGIGGFDLGFERAGFRTVWQCEIDKAAQGVLRRHFLAAKLHSDVCEVGAHNLEPVDVVTFGSPCQDLSVAGKRAGLAGGRSGLFHEAARIIRELRERYGKPDFAIWENVPGAFSSNEGKDFEAVVQAMVDLGARDICWRVLDSRYFGVAQRRRRVFLVADFGGERAEQVLFEPESLSGDFKKGGAKRKGAARGVGTSTTSSGDAFRILRTDEYRADTVASTVSARDYKSATDLILGQGYIPQVLGCLDGGAHPGSYNGQDAHNDPIIVQPVTLDSVAGPLDASYYKGQGSRQGGEREFVAMPVAVPVAAFDLRNVTSKANRSKVEYGLPCHTLHQAPPSAVLGSPLDASDAVVCATGDVTHALTCTASHGATEDGTGRGVPRAAHLPMQVRRLTPVECESLQGFPRDWTAEATLPDGTIKPQADGPRYKQLGNAVTVNVAEWIARRVAATLAP